MKEAFIHYLAYFLFFFSFQAGSVPFLIPALVALETETSFATGLKGYLRWSMRSLREFHRTALATATLIPLGFALFWGSFVKTHPCSVATLINQFFFGIELGIPFSLAVYFFRRVRCLVIIQKTGEWKALIGNPENIPSFRRHLCEAKFLLGSPEVVGVRLV